MLKIYGYNNLETKIALKNITYLLTYSMVQSPS